MANPPRVTHFAVQCALHLETWADGWSSPPNLWAGDDEFALLRALTDWRMEVDGHPGHWAHWLRNGMPAANVLREIQRYVEGSW